MHLFSKLPYDPRRDFTTIGAISRLPVALVVRKGVSVEALQALIGPAGMSDTAVQTLNMALNDALRDPQVLAFLARIGAEALPGTPADLARLAREADARWGPIVKALELRID